MLSFFRKIRKKNQSDSGFSLAELLITISLFLMLAGIGMGSYVDYYRTSQANQEMDAVLTLVKRTRARAIKSPNGEAHGLIFDMDLNHLISFEGVYSSGHPNNKTLGLRHLQVQQLAIQPQLGLTNQLVFEPKTGKSQNTGFILFSSPAGEYRFEINQQGLID